MLVGIGEAGIVSKKLLVLAASCWPDTRPVSLCANYNFDCAIPKFAGKGSSLSLKPQRSHTSGQQNDE
jgi:hypothetical protein